jgi:prophage antirepressor-like protein
MNKLQIFNNEEFGEIRTITIDGEIWFVLADVCKALELSNPRMVAKRLDEDEVCKFDLRGQSGLAHIVNESGLYKVILRSDKPEAKPFTKWITSEVLPAIRKTGKYEIKTNKNKTLDQEIKLKNSRSRIANAYLKIANNTALPNEYRQIMLTCAANELSGTDILPLPTSERRTYSSEEIGEKLGISANKVGRLANANNLKTEEFGIRVWDKSKYSSKQVEAFRYYENVISTLEEILKTEE